MTKIEKSQSFRLMGVIILMSRCEKAGKLFFFFKMIHKVSCEFLVNHPTQLPFREAEKFSGPLCFCKNPRKGG